MEPNIDSPTPEEPANIVALPGATERRFSAPENFINRELSWLEFNRRVLEEAQDPTQPLIERVKFLTIFSSNLDEFFEIRVAGIKQQIESETSDVGADGLSPTDTFNAIQRTVREMVATQYTLWKDELVPTLAKNGIRFHSLADLNTKRAAWARRYFREEVFPLLTPLAVDASHPFPQLLNKSHNLLVRARAEQRGRPLHAIVQVPRALPRLILMPRGKGGRRTLGLHLSRFADQASHRRSFSRFVSRWRARLSRHAQQRSLYRRGRGRKSSPQHRAGVAAFEPRQCCSPGSRSGLPEGFSWIASRVFRSG